MEITTELLADLKAKAQAATPGPWRVNQKWGDVETDAMVPQFVAGPTDAPEADYIAAASPDVVLALIGRIEKLEKDLDGLCHDDEAKALKIERLEREADWLAENAMRDMCPYEAYDWNKKTDKRPLWCDLHVGPYSECDCSGDNGECWRKAAQEALEADDEAMEAEAEAKCR